MSVTAAVAIVARVHAWCSALCPNQGTAVRVGLLLHRPLMPEERPRVKGVDLMWYDITGSEEGIEYQILDTSNTTHIKVRAAQLLQSSSRLGNSQH